MGMQQTCTAARLALAPIIVMVTKAMQKRLIPLEGCRGIAALVVLVHHFFLGFDPVFTGRLAEFRNAESWVGHAFFVAFNGAAAVGFFFTLSGFVLTWGYFHTGDDNTIRRGLLKRWPRLAGLVVVTTVASWGLMASGLYAHTQAAGLTGSTWLATAFGAEPPPLSFSHALWQGLTTFFTGYASWNSNLWTMRAEFLGSVLVYLAAPFLAKVVGAQKPAQLGHACVLLALSTLFLDVPLFPFVVGMGLSWWLSRRTYAVHIVPACGAILIGLYLLGYYLPQRHYAWVRPLLSLPSLGPAQVMLLLHSLGSLLVIGALMTSPRLFGYFKGPVARWLGEVSFSLYLVHLLVICSVSSWACIWARGQGWSDPATLALTAAVTLVTSLGAAQLLARMDAWWVQRVNTWMPN
jgi:peptidoglycan/LPS O-acetylase OafA/YrhL